MKISKTQIFRLLSLTFFIIFVLVASYRHQKLGGGPTGAPPVDNICPFGGLETIYKYLAGGEFLKRTGISNFVVLTGSIILAIFLGRFFCGWICAIGGLQEYTTKLRNITIKKRFVIPESIDKYLRYLKYILLILILFFTWKLKDMFIRPYDPFASFAHIFAGFDELFTKFLIGFLVLILSIILSFFFDRFFCKYLCPLGAFLAIIYKIFPFYKIKRDKKTCINCNKCSNICPVNIPVAKLDKVSKAECINCVECVTVCPTKKDTLKPTIFTFFLKAFLIGIIGLSIYSGTIFISRVTGIWKDEKESLKTILKDGDKLNPYNIRGFMTIRDISNEFGINIDNLYKNLNINKSDVPEETKIKDLSKYNKDLNEDKVREIVANIINYNKSPSYPDTSEIKGSWKLQELLDAYNIDKKEFYQELNKILKKKKIEEYNFNDNTTLKIIKERISEEEGLTFEIERIREIVKKIKNEVN